MNASPVAPPSPASLAGKHAALALAVAVHLLLALFLFYGVRWQTRAPEAVEVELVRTLPASAAPAPPVAEPPRPEPRPEPRAEPKAEPVAKLPPRPDIALKDKTPPKPVAKELPKEPPKPLAKADPFQEQLKRESEKLAQNRVADAIAKEEAQLRAAKAAAARSKATGAWLDAIAGRIKQRLNRPPGASGNPVAVYEITLLPDGALLGEPRKIEGTGNTALDTAIERAIVGASPLPKPADPSVYERVIRLRFRPLEE